MGKDCRAAVLAATRLDAEVVGKYGVATGSVDDESGLPVLIDTVCAARSNACTIAVEVNAGYPRAFD